MKKNSLPKVFDSKTPKIFKDKKLHNANFGNFRNTDYQVFLHLVSKIGGVDEYGKYLQPTQLKRDHILTAMEFSKLFNIAPSHCYGILKRAVDKLMKTDIRIEKPDDSGFWRINICSMAEYNKTEGSITISFTDHIMPYLSQVKARFVLYNLKEISQFRSLYTTRLYELLQEFKETGWMLKSINQLRDLFAVGNKFTSYNDFKKYTFGYACQEINNNKCGIGLSFEEYKEGRKVTAIKFLFKPVEVKQVINQKTGHKTNIYTKQKPSLKKKIDKTVVSNHDVVQGQLSLLDLNDLKSIKTILSSFLTKFRS